jgi:D-alanine-D-alanine ligase
MRIVVTFDTPYDGWDHPDHERQMATEVAAWKHDEPEMEYQIADALRERGHDVMLIGVRNDLQYLVSCLDEIRPDLVFNAVEAFHGNAGLEYMVPGILEAEGYRYTGSPPLALLVSRNKAMSKKVLAYHGIRVPGFVTCRPGEALPVHGHLRFPLIVKPLQSDASAGIAQASVVQDETGLADRVAMIHQRFDQPAIAEEFVDGRELYVSLIGNGRDLDILPITEMVFDKRRTRTEERIATQFAKWDEDYRARKGIRNVFARPLARSVRARIEEICRAAFRALWLRDYARLDIRLAPDGEIWVLEANANPFISYGHDMANAAEKAGMDYYAFIQRLVDEAVARYGHA